MIEAYLGEVKIKMTDMHQTTKNQMSKLVSEWDNKKWEDEVRSKTSISIYAESKNKVQEDAIYDNTPSSVILYRARTNTLPLFDRKRHVGEETTCPSCKIEEEDIEHFILRCPNQQSLRNEIIELQQPFEENIPTIISRFLFGEENMQEKKEALY